jgi:hypothetical protein
MDQLIGIPVISRKKDNKEKNQLIGFLHVIRKKKLIRHATKK